LDGSVSRQRDDQVGYPPQVELVNCAFTPTEKEIAFARRVVAAFEKAEREGSSSNQLDDCFIDYPIVYKAQRTLDAVRATKEMS
jgi:citrate lyase subunit beta / citryl-CoA lyase